MVKKGRGDPMVRADGRTKPDREWYPDDFDWYLKWVASVIVLCSLAASSRSRVSNLRPGFGFVGILLWCWVSVIWKDRALIMLKQYPCSCWDGMLKEFTIG